MKKANYKGTAFENKVFGSYNGKHKESAMGTLMQNLICSGKKTTIDKLKTIK